MSRSSYRIFWISSLHASFTYTSALGKCVDLCFHHPKSNLRRSFAYEERWGPLNDYKLFYPGLENRIVEVDVDFGLFAVIAAVFPSLPTLSSLTIIGNIFFATLTHEDEDSDDDDSEDDSESDASEDGGSQFLTITAPSSKAIPSLKCPTLSKVVLADSGTTAVDDLLTLMGWLLCQTTRGGVKLELQDCAFDWETSRLWGFFSRIVTVPGRMEQPYSAGERFPVY